MMEQAAASAAAQARPVQPAAAQPAMAGAGVGAAAPAGAPARPGLDPADPSTWGQVGRNEPCPCGSGQRYKNCHGKLT